MEQEATVYKVTNIGKVTGEVILKSLWEIAKHLEARNAYKRDHQVFQGETNYNKFMVTNNDKDVVEFKAGEVHMDKLKDYLNQYGIGFATKHNKATKTSPETTELFFELKNKAIVEQGLEKAIREMTTNPKKVNNLVLKRPGDRTPAEKIAYFKSQFKFKKDKPIKLKNKAQAKGV